MTHRTTALVLIAALAAIHPVTAQQSDKNINPAEVERIEKILSSDAMQGRRTFTPGIEKAADFIEGQFREAKLLPLEHSHSYRQPFAMATTELHSVAAKFDDDSIPADHIAVISSETQLNIDQ